MRIRLRQFSKSIYILTLLASLLTISFLFQNCSGFEALNDGAFSSRSIKGKNINTNFCNGAAHASVKDENGNLYIGGSFSAYGSISPSIAAFKTSSGALNNKINFGDGIYGTVNAIVELPGNAGFVVGGRFTRYKNTTVNNIFKIDHYGNLDPNFALNYPLIGTAAQVLSMELSKDEKSIFIFGIGKIGGDATTGPSRYLTKIDLNGNMDESFYQNFLANYPEDTILHSQFILTNDNASIYISSQMPTNFNNPYALIRYSMTGQLDRVYKLLTPGKVVAFATSDEGFYAGGHSYDNVNAWPNAWVLRVDPNGAIDTSFSQGSGIKGTLTSLVAGANNSVYVGGEFTSFNGKDVGRIVHLDAVGNLDLNFSSTSGFDGPVNKIAINKTKTNLFVFGTFSKYGTHSIGNTVKLSSEGVLNYTFNINGLAPTSGSDLVKSFVLSDDENTLLAGGIFLCANSFPAKGILKIHNTGYADEKFSVGVNSNGFEGAVYSLAVSSSALYVGGGMVKYKNQTISNIAKLTLSGELDNNFLPSGVNERVFAIAVGKKTKSVYIGGLFSKAGEISATGILKVSEAGTIDRQFTPEVGLEGISDPGIIIGTYFQPIGTLGVFSIAISPDENFIFAGGDFHQFKGKTANYIAKVSANGVLDETFNPQVAGVVGHTVSTNGFATDVPRRVCQREPNFGVSCSKAVVTSIVLNNAGTKLNVAGSFYRYRGTLTPQHMVQLNSDGSLSNDFNLAAGIGFNGEYITKLIMPDENTLYAIGPFTRYGNKIANRIAKISTTGSLDLTFNSQTGANGFSTPINYIVSLFNNNQISVDIAPAFTQQDMMLNGIVTVPANITNDPRKSGSTLNSNGQLQPVVSDVRIF
jgi:hypothetical protein